MELIFNIFYLYKTRPLGAVAKRGGGGILRVSRYDFLTARFYLFLVIFCPFGFPYIAHSFQKIKLFSRLGNVSTGALRKGDRNKYCFGDAVCYKRKRHNG
jgi:hypothetical protein